MPSHTVDPLDHRLHAAQRRGYPLQALHEIPPATLDEALKGVCDENCTRNGGTQTCRCYGTTPETTEGGW